MHFSDFQIRAWQIDEAHARVMVQSSPVGDMRRPLTVSCRSESLRRVAGGKLGSMWLAEPGTRQRAIQYGQGLASVLLPRPVLALLDSSLERLPPEGGLRLRLCLDKLLVDLPWEFLCRPDAPDGDSLAGFLALDPRISLVREAPTTSVRLLPSTEAQRLVFAAAVAGKGVLTPGAEEEFEQISGALEPLQAFLKVEFLEAGGDSIETALSTPTAIFHYSGTTGVIEGRSCLAKTYGGADLELLYSEALGTLLHRAATRLAVFGADNSGQWDFVEPLIRAGVPALVGAQGVLHPKAYAAFCGKLYGSLAIGLSLDESVIGARLHLLETEIDPSKEDYNWAGFMVYMPSTEAVLFPRPEDRALRERQEIAKRERQETIDNVGKRVGLPAERPAGPNKRDLRKVMVQAFNRDELVVLCADVQQDLTDDGITIAVNLEMVGGDTRERQVLELIDYLDRRGMVSYLVAAVRRERPGMM